MTTEGPRPPSAEPSPDGATLSSLLGPPGSVAPTARIQFSGYAVPGKVIAGRYTIREPIGRGGMGEVWRAADAIGGGEVAIKLVPALAPAEQDQVRRELAALRWLRLPGVVQLLDDGRVDDRCFLVMELVEGEPFLDRRARWEEVAAPTLELLENLARVHFAGVVHRDLKPANVRLDRAGHPVLLDFGIARGVAIGGGTVGVEGTPFTMAPEVLAGRPCDGRADLYALGVMLYYCLSSGRMPHGGTRADILSAERVPLKVYAPGLPANVRHTIDAMLSIAPTDRPSSALEALSALGGHPPPTLTPAADAADGQGLRPLFVGQDGFLHVQQDAATLLWERTGGARDRVARELAGWIRSGLAHWIGDQVKIDRSAVERLRGGLRLGPEPDLAGLSAAAAKLYRRLQIEWPDGSAVEGPDWDELQARGLVWALPDGRAGVTPYVRRSDDDGEHLRIAASLASGEQRLRQLVAGEAPPEVVAAEAEETARALQDSGQLSRALAAVEVGLAAARRAEDATREERLLAELTTALLAQNSRSALDRAHYELNRSELSSAGAMRGLVRAFVAAWSGEPERAEQELATVPVFAHPELEVWRQASRVRAATYRSLPEQQHVLDELAGWAAEVPAVRHHRYLGWLANVRYQRGDYAAAARIWAAAAVAPHSAAFARLVNSGNAAWAWLDALDLEQAVRAATETARLARDMRLANHEARAAAVLRMAAYRQAVPLLPQVDTVGCAAEVGVYHHAIFALCEGAIAWRCAQHDVASRLATDAVRGFRSLGRHAVACLAGALAALCDRDLHRAAECARQLPLEGAPEIEIQVCGLLARVDREGSGPYLARARALAHVRPPASHPIRLDVLSIEECLEVAP